MIESISGPVESVSQSLRGIGAAVNSTNATARLRTSLDQTNRSLDAMRARMAESLAVGYALKMALQAPIEAATKFETALLDIAQKAELGDEAMNALGHCRAPAALRRLSARGPRSTAWYGVGPAPLSGTDP
ncbi:MAG: hypothetical protein B7Y80_20470 [Hyphomicrobium sp. 32-62-53]|nr:MAG: hypothetical protein B7Z29_20345 [Hyphomicrobium sp. 12-62-95]OYX97233.1 MAG: hypothetical protein B7Y80_20470 [Hyphomicrobium sp. 32-62-53]